MQMDCFFLLHALIFQCIHMQEHNQAIWQLADLLLRPIALSHYRTFVLQYYRTFTPSSHRTIVRGEQ